MDVDTLQELLAKEGMERWRDDSWPESGALSSKVAAHQYRRLYELLNQFVDAESPTRLLDWGSGSAVFSYGLAMEGIDVSATDPAEPPMGDFISTATDGRFSFTKSIDPVALPYDAESFDVVLSNGTLEHVRETGGSDTGSLAEIFRVLRPGGVFICTHLPNHKSYIEAYVRLFDRAGRYYHPFRYSEREIREKAANAGFGVLELSRYGSIPRNPLSKLPPNVRDDPRFLQFIDTVDDALSNLFSPFCQNFSWVGKKP